MSLLVERRRGDIDASTENHDVNWSSVESAVQELDGKYSTSVVLGQFGVDTIGCSGGPARYMVEAHWMDDEDHDYFAWLAEPTAPATVQTDLIIGGQLGLYPANWLVSIDRAMAAVRYYFDHGTIDRNDTWQFTPPDAAQRIG
jgi:hypothetical protein